MKPFQITAKASKPRNLVSGVYLGRRTQGRAVVTGALGSPVGESLVMPGSRPTKKRPAPPTSANGKPKAPKASSQCQPRFRTAWSGAFGLTKQIVSVPGGYWSTTA